MNLDEEKQFFIDKLRKDHDVNNLLRSIPVEEVDVFLNDINQIRQVLHIKNNTDRAIYNEYEKLIQIPEGTEQTLIRELHEFNNDFYEDRLPEHYILHFDRTRNFNETDYGKYYNSLAKSDFTNEFNNSFNQPSSQEQFIKSTDNSTSDKFISPSSNNNFKRANSLVDDSSLTIDNMTSTNSNYSSYFDNTNEQTTEITRADLFSNKKQQGVIDLGMIDDEYNEYDLYADESNNKKAQKLLKKKQKEEKKLKRKKTVEKTMVSQEFEIKNTTEETYVPELSQPNTVTRQSDLHNIISTNAPKEKIINYDNEIIVDSESDKQNELELIKRDLEKGQYGRLNLSRPMSLTCARYMRKLDNLKKGFEKTYGSELLRKITDWVKMENALYESLDRKEKLETARSKQIKLRNRFK